MGDKQRDMGQTSMSTSGSRCTRSRAAPEWTSQDTLILVNEIAAVEGDCQNALSSYQKWTIIAENCTALEVVRTSNQCRRKWDSLLADFKLIKGWESNGCYYSDLNRAKRKANGLPLDFDEEVYKAIDNFMKVQEDGAGTEPDSDPEAEDNVLEAIESGPKKHREETTVEIKHTLPEKDIKQKTRVLVRRKQKPRSKTKDVAKKPRRRETSNGKKPVQPDPEKTKRPYENTLSVVDESEQREKMLASKVKENTQMVHAILAGNGINEPENMDEEDMGDLNDSERLEAVQARVKAEKLLACLDELSRNLGELCDVVEECRG